MRKRREPHALSEDEQLARYAYVLGNVPASVADRAYASVYVALGEDERRRVVDGLRAQLPADERHDVATPFHFARLLRNLHARAAVVSLPDAARVATEFVRSASVVAYFTAGAGSVTMDQQPPWVHELTGHETAPVDGGRVHHRRGAEWGQWFG